MAGVTVTATRGGAEIGKDTTASDGKWEIALPGAGRYTITLDVATLPAGLNVPVPDGESRTVIFQLTTGTPAPANGPGPGQPGRGGGGPPQNAVTAWLDRSAQLLVEGIKFGSIIAITAVGLSLIFGTTGLINFAHGALVTLGATVAFMLNASVLGPQLQLIPAVLVTVAFGAAFCGVLELGLRRGRMLALSGGAAASAILIAIGVITVLALGGSHTPRSLDDTRSGSASATASAAVTGGAGASMVSPSVSPAASHPEPSAPPPVVVPSPSHAATSSRSAFPSPSPRPSGSTSSSCPHPLPHHRCHRLGRTY